MLVARPTAAEPATTDPPIAIPEPVPEQMRLPLPGMVGYGVPSPGFWGGGGLAKGGLKVYIWRVSLDSLLSCGILVSFMVFLVIAGKRVRTRVPEGVLPLVKYMGI
jgi:hypothetical protein